MASELAKRIVINTNSNIIIDKSKNKEKDISKFNNVFIDNLNNQNDFKVTLEHHDSKNYKGLQIMDIIILVVFQRFEHDNEEFINLIDDKINIEKVFKD